MRWHKDHTTCTHANDDVCPTCDFDGYYASSYADCPWRGRFCEGCAGDVPADDAVKVIRGNGWVDTYCGDCAPIEEDDE